MSRHLRPAWQDVTCWSCRQPIPQGDPIQWTPKRWPNNGRAVGQRGRGWWGHPECVAAYIRDARTRRQVNPVT